MEPVQEARDREQAEVAALAEVDAVKAGEAVSRQVPAVTVSAPNAGRRRTTSWEAPVMSRNVLSAEQR